MKWHRIAVACIATLCWLGFVRPALAQTTIPLDPKATYLRTNQDPQALNAVPISLDQLGIGAGDTITVRMLGDFSFCYDCGWPEEPVSLAGGVFSSNSVLLPPNKLNRVPGAQAIRQGSSPPCVSWNTYFGDQPTDIPEDFGFSSFSAATVKVPQGAHYLFVAVVDSLYGDNADPNGDLAVQIQKALVAIPLNVLWRVIPWEPDRMTTTGGEELQYPSEGQLFYVDADSQEPGTTALNRFFNGPDHRDSTLTKLPGYWSEGPEGFPWTSKSLAGLSPMVEGFNPETGDYALMQPGEQLAGYSTKGLSVFGYKRYYNQQESPVRLTKGNTTVESNQVYGGAVWRWTWNGMQFMNHGEPGRGAHTILFFDIGEGPRGMTEGSDGFQHGSPLVSARNEGLTHKTRTVPVDIDGGGPDNPLLWRDVVLGKDLLLDFNNLGSVAKYATYVSLPSPIQQASLYEPIITLRAVFNRFWVYQADSDVLQEVSDQMPAPCSDISPLGLYSVSPDFGGVIVSDSSANYAFGIYGVNVSRGGSITDLLVRRQNCWGDGGASEDGMDHSRIDVVRNASLPAGESRYNVYAITDTVQNARQKMRQLFLSGAK